MSDTRPSEAPGLPPPGRPSQCAQRWAQRPRRRFRVRGGSGLVRSREELGPHQDRLRDRLRDRALPEPARTGLTMKGKAPPYGEVGKGCGWQRTGWPHRVFSRGRAPCPQVASGLESVLEAPEWAPLDNAVTRRCALSTSAPGSGRNSDFCSVCSSAFGPLQVLVCAFVLVRSRWILAV